jgi:predicted kinase
VAERSARADDPSDATAAVVEAQVQWREPASDDERARWWQIDTAASPQQQAAALDRVVAALRR